MRYVSRYRCYPIYEPAEGGYFYEGRELVSTVPYVRLCDAWKAIKAVAAEYGFRNVGRYSFADEAHINGRYIGEGELLVLEEAPGENEAGWHPYE